MHTSPFFASRRTLPAFFVLLLAILNISTQAATVNGTVRKLADSTTLQGVKVYWLNGATPGDSTTTDSAGAYAFADVPTGFNRTVQAVAVGFAPASVTVNLFQSTSAATADFYLGLPGVISGTVHKSDSTALAGAMVYLRRGSTFSTAIDSAVTDGVGHYAFSNVAPGTPNYYLTASAANFVSATNSNLALADGGTLVSEFYLTPILPGSISGAVRRLSDSTAVASVLMLLRQGTSDTSAILDSARTDSSGLYEFPNLTASTGGFGGGATQYRVYASAAGFVSATNTGITVNNGAATTSNFYLGEPGSIAGGVRKSTDSTALSGATVYLRRGSANSAILDSAVTDGAGHYAFSDLAPGTPNYWITASLAAYAGGTNANVVLPSGASVTSDVYLAPIVAGTITGTVRKAADTTQALVGARVLLRRGSDTSAVLDSARTDSLGHYAFANVAPLTPNYWINASATGYVSVTNANVAVANGGSVASNFSLALPGTLSGTIRALPDSSALRGALVQMRRGSGNSTVLDSARTDSLGNYAFTGLAAATNYRITASASGYVTASNTNIAVTAGNATTSDLALAMARSLITGKVARASDSTVFTSALVLLRRGSDTSAVLDSARTDSLGRYAFANLTPGTPNFWVTVTGVTGYAASTRANVALAGNDTAIVDFFLAGASGVIRPAASIAAGTRVERIGDQLLIHLNAATVDRSLTIRDVRGVQWYRSTVTAGATQVVVPTGRAPKAGALIRLE